MNLLVLAGILCNVRDLDKQLALILLIKFPLLDPGIQFLQLWTEHLEETGLLDQLKNGKEDIMPDLVVFLKKVEKSGEDGESQSRPVDWRGGDRSGEVLADLVQEHVDVW